jgi:hypothetical protein
MSKAGKEEENNLKIEDKNSRSQQNKSTTENNSEDSNNNLTPNPNITPPEYQVTSEFKTMIYHKVKINKDKDNKK